MAKPGSRTGDVFTTGGKLWMYHNNISPCVIYRKICREANPRFDARQPEMNSPPRQHWREADPTCSYDLAFSARRRLTTQVKAKMRFLFRNYAGYFRVNSQPINHIWRASCMLIEKTSPISLPFLEAPLLGWHIKFFWAGENEAIPVLIVNTKCANLLPWGMYKLVIFYKTLIYTN